MKAAWCFGTSAFLGAVLCCSGVQGAERQRDCPSRDVRLMPNVKILGRIGLGTEVLDAVQMAESLGFRALPRSPDDKGWSFERQANPARPARQILSFSSLRGDECVDYIALAIEASPGKSKIEDRIRSKSTDDQHVQDRARVETDDNERVREVAPKIVGQVQVSGLLKFGKSISGARQAGCERTTTTYLFGNMLTEVINLCAQGADGKLDTQRKANSEPER
jgi:hypothetical protein